MIEITVAVGPMQGGTAVSLSIKGEPANVHEKVYSDAVLAGCREALKAGAETLRAAGISNRTEWHEGQAAEKMGEEIDAQRKARFGDPSKN